MGTALLVIYGVLVFVGVVLVGIGGIAWIVGDGKSWS